MARRAVAEKSAADAKAGSFIREMFEKGRRLMAEHGAENVFDFSLGNPNATPPREFFDAVKTVAAEYEPGRHRYMPNAGFDETRAAVAAFLSAEYRAPFTAADIVMTSGAAGALNVLLRAICDPGDEVIVFAPFFPEYRFYVEHAGGRFVVVGSKPDFQPDLAALQAAITPKTRAVLINSPGNPSGAVYGDEVLSAIARVLRDVESRGQPVYLIADDPYRRILFDRDWCPTPVGKYPRTIVCSSYAKDLSIAGERAGYIAVPPQTPARDELLPVLTTLNRTLGFVNCPAFMQRVIARCASACCDISFYRRNRDLLCDALRTIGYELTTPAGALYAFPRTPIADDRAFVDMLLEERVLAVPGAGFGAPGHIRISYCVHPTTIERGLPGFKVAFERAARGARR